VSGVAIDPIGAMTHAEPPPGYPAAYAEADEANGDVAPWLRARRTAEHASAEGTHPSPAARSRVASVAARIRGRRTAADGTTDRTVDRAADRAADRTADRVAVDPTDETVRIELPDRTDDEDRHDPR
jgi:hypothetical protein